MSDYEVKLDEYSTSMLERILYVLAEIRDELIAIKAQQEKPIAPTKK